MHEGAGLDQWVREPGATNNKVLGSNSGLTKPIYTHSYTQVASLPIMTWLGS